MRFAPKFHQDDNVLLEQITLMQQGLAVATIISLLISGTMVFISYEALEDSRLLIWFALFVLLSAVRLRNQFHRSKQKLTPRPEAHKEFYITILSNIIYCYLPLTFINNDAPTTVILAIAIATGGLSTGSVASLGSCRPILFAYVAPKMLSIIIALIMLNDSDYHTLTYASILYLLSIFWFGSKMEKNIVNSIELRFKNDDLVGQLRSANKAKSMFLASASHDLRQPLHALGLLNETLGSTPLNTQQKEVQQHMMSAIDSTRNMLDALLDISKLDAGVITASPKPFFVQALFNKLESELAETASDSNLIYRTRETISAAYSDPFIVELMVRNLISNAIQYTQEGGVLIACRNRHPNKLVIEVWDTGIGIPDGKEDEIFAEFQQLSNPERDSKKGFGLGLAITKGLAKTIGTEITVSSILGKGSVFRFTLPVSQSDVVEDISESDYDINFIGKSVLIIDDNKAIRDSMHRLISNWGCDCMCAESADEALEIIKNKPLDIMLVDYRLQENKTGREAINSVRRSRKKNVPAIIITGDTASDRIKEAQAADAILLHKPVSTKQLMRMMNHLLSPL